MTDTRVAEDILIDARNRFPDSVSSALKLLLEEKHLYQSCRVDTSGIPDPYLFGHLRGSSLPSLSMRVAPPRTTQEESQEVVRSTIQKKIFNAPWSIENPRRRRLRHPGGTDTNVELVTIDVPDAKLYCRHCRRREAFNLVSAEEAPSGPHRPVEIVRLSGRNFDIPGHTRQAFVLEYECQSCKNEPEVFLIRREGLKLTLCGRAPMEVVEAPACIPKAVRPHFRGALLAYQSGQALPAMFMLRTTVEQWARRTTGSTDRDASRMIDRYMEDLPEDFKARFPSFAALYGELSDDLHAAKGDTELLERSVDAIEKHFEGRKAFDLDATPPERGKVDGP